MEGGLVVNGDSNWSREDTSNVDQGNESGFEDVHDRKTEVATDVTGKVEGTLEEFMCRTAPACPCYRNLVIQARAWGVYLYSTPIRLTEVCVCTCFL
jgi:hypothetical protein